MSDGVSRLPPHLLGSLHSQLWLFGFSLSAVFIASLRPSPSVLRPTSKTGCQVPTMVLSEARGLWLFRVIREGLESAERLGAPRHAAPNLSVETRSRTRASQELDGPPPGEFPGDGTDPRDTQAVCGFRCWASNETPFFQTIKVIAAILRASVSRAISGRMPLATSAA